jgi:hypothetical protein
VVLPLRFTSFCSAQDDMLFWGISIAFGSTRHCAGVGE